MTTYETANNFMEAFFDYIMERENGCTFLFPDEIAEIIRSVPDGAMFKLYDMSNYPDAEYTLYTVKKRYHRTTFSRDDGYTVTVPDMVEMIYNAIENDDMVTIDDNDILTY